MQLSPQPETISAFQRFLGMVALIKSQMILPIPPIYNEILFFMGRDKTSFNTSLGNSTIGITQSKLNYDTKSGKDNYILKENYPEERGYAMYQSKIIIISQKLNT